MATCVMLPSFLTEAAFPFDQPRMILICPMLKSIMSQVYKHAQRHELILATIGQDGRPTNPVVLAR